MKLQAKSYLRINLVNRLLSLIGAALFLIPLTATAQATGGGMGPDLNVTKTCAVNAPQSVLCTVTVRNIGNIASVAPLSLSDIPTAPPGSTFTGGGGSLPISCTPGAGAVLPISCTANKSLQPNESGTALFSFTVPQGGVFRNCATVSQAQNPGTLPDPNPANNTNICTSVDVPGPSGGKLTIAKKIINNNAGIPTPGPFEVQVKCNPNVPYSSVSLTGPSFQHSINLPAGGNCKIEEVPPKAPPGCKWITTYPSGQTGKVGDTLVVQNELKCEPSCPSGQSETTFPGTDTKYCCDGKPGSEKFCCWKKK